tara:strand:+ start:1937 stop:2236 length:300 start_codon:yes stop_codon:yes gene_type:complete
MLSFKATAVAETMRSLKRDRDSLLSNFADDVLKKAKANTPILTGKARRGWRKRRSRQGFNIDNRTPYIVRLENGHSKQAPRGILGPTVRQARLPRRLNR